VGSELHMYSWMQRLLRQIGPTGDFAAAKKELSFATAKNGEAIRKTPTLPRERAHKPI